MVGYALFEKQDTYTAENQLNSFQCTMLKPLTVWITEKSGGWGS